MKTMTMRDITITALLLIAVLSHSHAQQPTTRIDPRHPAFKYLPELGRMIGQIKKIAVGTHGENYGSRIYKLGDCNSDGRNDWGVSRLRCDTTFNGAFPEEVLLYHGVKGGLPAVESGQRIGPSELNSQTKILTSGNWDGDAYRDLCVTTTIIGDTSHGNNGFSTARIVIFWGQPDGVYSLADTTRLVMIDDLWLGAITAYSADFDHTGIETLFIFGGGGLDRGTPLTTNYMHFFHGHSHDRWGRNGTLRTPDWSWSKYTYARVGILDQDADGHLDLVEYQDKTGSGVYGSMTITYGGASGYFDTNDVETVRFDSVHGHISMFADITGDAAPAAPELLVNTGDDNTCRIYAGKRGQRLKEQFGSGDDPPGEGKGWWRRPWAVIWLPAKLDDGWGISGNAPIYDLGDVNVDGIRDLWLKHDELLLGYVSGNRLDSLIDAIVTTPYSDVLSIGNLGDIDGSGLPTIAISYDQFPSDYQHPFNGGVMFVKPSDEVPSTGGTYRKLPQEVSDVQDIGGQKEMIGLRAVPNPSDGRVVLSWKSMQAGVLTISDALGRETLHVALDAATQEYVWDTRHLVAGTYFISLEVDHRQLTIKVTVP